MDSFALKRDLNKAKNIRDAQKTSLEIKHGVHSDNCTLCGNSGNKFLVDIYGFSYYECNQCGSAYVSNRPDDKEISRIYNSDYYTEVTKIVYANDNIIDFRVKNIAEPKVDFVLNNITTKKKTWTDVGCGVGEIVKVVQDKGWDVVGVETNDSEREYGIKKFGINIDGEFITESNIDTYGKKGVVSMFSIIEHLSDPKSIIRHISKVQEKDDNIVVEVPHYPSLTCFSQMTFPEHINRMMHPPLHLYLFSLKALKNIFEENGYEITAVWYFGQDFYEMFSTLGLFAPELNNSILHTKVSSLINDFQEVIDKKELSDEIIVVGRKR